MRSRLGLRRESIGNSNWETRGRWKSFGLRNKKTATEIVAVWFSQKIRLERVGLQFYGWVHGAEVLQCGIGDGGGGGGCVGCTTGLLGLGITVALGAASAVVKAKRASIVAMIEIPRINVFIKPPGQPELSVCFLFVKRTTKAGKKLGNAQTTRKPSLSKVCRKPSLGTSPNSSESIRA